MSCSKINLALLNGHLICGLCGGYLIDATVLTNCIHAYCRSCILKYILMENKVCPLCQTPINLQPGRPGCALRPDVTLQRVVYKLVPGLLRVELDRITEFEQRFAQNPSKVLKEVNAHHPITRDNLSSFDRNSKSDQFGSSLSSPTPTALATRSLSRSMSLPTRHSIQLAPSSLHSLFPEEGYSCLIDTEDSVSISMTRVPPLSTTNDPSDSDPEEETLYFLCPSSSTVAHLQRLLLAKYTLTTSPATAAISVDVYLGVECLEPAHSLRELAYLYAWPTHRLLLPFKFRFADLGKAWWGSPMPRLEAPTDRSSYPSDGVKRKRIS